MAVRRAHLATVLWFLSSLCAAEPVVGLLTVDSTGRAQIYTAERLKHGESVELQYVASDGSMQCCVRRTVGRSVVAAPMASDEAKGRAVMRHDLQGLRLRGGPFFGWAFASRGQRFASAGTGLTLKGQSEIHPFRTCLGSEGVHLFGGDDRSEVHLYLAFDYAVAPTCRWNASGGLR